MNEGLIVDYSVLFHRTFWGNKNAIMDNPHFLAHGILNTLFKTIREFKTQDQRKMILAVDCPKRDCWRNDIFVEQKDNEHYSAQGYKGQRVRDETIDWNTLYGISNELLDVLDKYSDIPVISHPQAEADDIIYVGTTLFDRTIIVSNDGDFKQLHSGSVLQYNPITEKYITLDTTADEYLLTHILLGDKGDNIPQCKRGWGPVTIKKNLPNLTALLQVDQELNERFEINKRLIDLSEVPEKIKDEIISLYNTPKGKYNGTKLMQFFIKYSLRKVAEDISLLRVKDGNNISEFF